MDGLETPNEFLNKNSIIEKNILVILKANVMLGTTFYFRSDFTISAWGGGKNKSGKLYLFLKC